MLYLNYKSEDNETGIKQHTIKHKIFVLIQHIMDNHAKNLITGKKKSKWKVHHNTVLEKEY